MAYLDLTPMLQAMRARPSEFEMQGTYLRHKPSQHLVNFDIWGNARVHARCDCAMLDVTRDQSEELKSAIAAWKIVHWEPHLAEIAAAKRAVQINREFASHFRRLTLWQRVVAFFTAAGGSGAPFTIEETTARTSDMATSDMAPQPRPTAQRSAAPAEPELLSG